MPKGKAPISGAHGWAAQQPPMEEIVLTCKGLFRRKGMPESAPDEIKKCAGKIQKAIRSYRTYQATPMLTATERQRLLNKVVTAARKLNSQLMSGNISETAAEKLRQQLLDVDENTLDVIHKHLCRAGFEKGVSGLQLKLRDWNEADVEDEVSAMLDHICTLKDWVDDRKHWCDPLLVNLVLALAPEWQKLTGFSPSTVDPDIGEHPFAEWVNKLLETVREQQREEKKAPLPAVTRGSVEDILTHLKN